MKAPAKGDKILLKRDGGPVIEETCHQSHKGGTRYGMMLEVVTSRDYDTGAQYALFFGSTRELTMCDHIGSFSGDDNLKVVTFSTIFSPA